MDPSAMPPEDPMVDPNAPPDDPNAPPDDPDDPTKDAGGDDGYAKIIAFLESKLTPEDMATVRQLAAEAAGGGGGGPPGAEAPPDASPEAPPPDDTAPPSSEPPSEPDKSEDEMPENMPKAGKPPAMDAASIEASVIRRMNAVRAAERAVRPYVGDLAREFATDTQVYQWALRQLDVKTDGVHPSAYPTILAMMPKRDERTPSLPAMDAKSEEAFSARFKHVNRLKQS